MKTAFSNTKQTVKVRLTKSEYARLHAGGFLNSMSVGMYAQGGGWYLIFAFTTGEAWEMPKFKIEKKFMRKLMSALSPDYVLDILKPGYIAGKPFQVNGESILQVPVRDKGQVVAHKTLVGDEVDARIGLSKIRNSDQKRPQNNDYAFMLKMKRLQGKFQSAHV